MDGVCYDKEILKAWIVIIVFAFLAFFIAAAMTATLSSMSC
jgi:hypothetical protein